ncbi:MAG: hypothetical protein A3F16_07345 [Deltaproteobacteria bacterium RIFCSPHIGHO2_12_FULL_43_9]|nr:MAG: hypothetical protein A3F16_07345 [Deltaproteobacteria bacterium RIFCSPHIGHO2_12_FULL_43_9]
MKIPFFDLTRQYEGIKSRIDAAVLKRFSSQQFVGGEEVQRIETRIADFTGSRFAVGCGTGTDALILALKALGIGPGDEVIVPAYTFFASAEAVSWVGATPRFSDIERTTFNISPETVEPLINNNTKAIIPVHLFGQMVDVDGFKKLNAKYSIPIIEDAAQAIGAKFRDLHIGSLGLMTAISFYPTKNLGGAGDGGMVLTNDATIYAKLKSLRNHGEHENKRYIHQAIGTNSRLDAIQAAVLNVKLDYLNQWNERRRRIAGHYIDFISKKGIEIDSPLEVSPRYHVYHQFVIQTPLREQLREHFQNRGISTNIFYPLSVHLQPCFPDSGDRCPESDATCNRALALPIFPELTDDEVTYIGRSIEAF